MAVERDAERRLQAIGGYDWLLDDPDKQLWTASEVARAITASGLPTSYDTVARWFAEAVVTTAMGGKGRVASRQALMTYFLSTANDEQVATAQAGGGVQ